MAITLKFEASMISQETFEDRQKIITDIYKKSAQAAKRGEKIDLDLSGIKLDSTLLMQLPFSQLTSLNLSDCGLGDEAICCLLDEIKQTPNLSLHTLGLSKNSFGLKGAKALADMPKLINLQNLYLASNEGLNEEAVCAVVEGLKKGNPLEHLDLSCLEISKEPTASIISGLRVEYLELKGSKFSQKHLEMIREAIQKRGGQVATTTDFSPENSENSEYLNYKAETNPGKAARYVNLTVCAKQQQPQASNTSPNNESRNVFSIAQNC